MIGYIIIAVAVLILAYIVVLYFINAKKIKQKQNKKQEKPDEKAQAAETKPANKKTNMVEVKSQVIKGTMFEEAVKEAEAAGYKYNADTKPETAAKKDNSRLKLDREEFVPEIKRTDYGRLKPQKLVSERPEGPTVAAKDSKQASPEKKDSIGEQINNSSPELKALLINDVLNKKY